MASYLPLKSSATASGLAAVAADVFPYCSVLAQRKQGVRLLLLLLFIAFVSASAVSYLLRQSYIRDLNAKHDYIITSASAYLNRELGDVRNIVSLLYHDRDIHQGLKAEEPINTALLAQRFSGFAQSLDTILQIRWLDAQGNERVRVDSNADSVRQLSPSELQNKAGRYYFRDAMQVEPPAVYFSGLDLNVENKAIVRPYQPTLRAGIRTGVSDGKQPGLLLINYDFRRLLESLHTLSVDQSALFIADADGYWILHSQTELEWGHDLGHNDYTLRLQDPVLWQRLTETPVISAEMFSDRLVSALKMNLGQSSNQDGATRIYLMVQTRAEFMSAINWQSIWPGLLLAAVIVLLGGRLLHHDLLQQHQRYLLNRQLQQEKEALEVTNAKLDISLQEQRILQDELVETRKLSALGMMVAGVAHELNTPVGGALMLASTLENHLAELTKAVDAGLSRQALTDFIRHSQEGLKLLDENLKRAKMRVESFKRLAIDRASDEIVEFHLHQVCDDLLRSLHAMLNHSGVNVVTHIAADLRLSGYPGIISQILQNLIVNAVIHGLADVTGGQIKVCAEVDEQNQVILHVTDNGCGVRADIAGRLFDPFVTSARGQGSTGLGLHLVHQWVIHLLHGSIRAEEPTEGGLSFVIVFPREISTD